jgi:uncharacterized protein
MKAAIILGVILVASLFGNYFLFQNIQMLGQDIKDLNRQISLFEKQSEEIQEKLNSVALEKEQAAKLQRPEIKVPFSDSSKSITAVAVRPIIITDGFFQDVRYEGTVMNITVDIHNGIGLVLVNTEIPTGVDFQTSAKTAVQVAQRYTDANISDKDIIFSITAKNNDELQAVDGQSAGMAMTVLLVMEIEGRPINDKVLLTGTIQQDGSIGPIGGVAEKADAAGKYNADIFIVPKGQAITLVQECQESREGPFLYKSCKSEAKPLSPITEEKYGMRVVEATDLKSVLHYFEN